jgi:hypothetical protein
LRTKAVLSERPAPGCPNVVQSMSQPGVSDTHVHAKTEAALCMESECPPSTVRDRFEAR